MSVIRCCAALALIAVSVTGCRVLDALGPKPPEEAKAKRVCAPYADSLSFVDAQGFSYTYRIEYDSVCVGIQGAGK